MVAKKTQWDMNKKVPNAQIEFVIMPTLLETAITLKDVYWEVRSCIWYVRESARAFGKSEKRVVRKTQRKSRKNSEIIFADSKVQSWMDGALFRTEIASFDTLWNWILCHTLLNHQEFIWAHALTSGLRLSEICDAYFLLASAHNGLTFALTSNCIIHWSNDSKLACLSLHKWGYHKHVKK